MDKKLYMTKPCAGLRLCGYVATWLCGCLWACLVLVPLAVLAGQVSAADLIEGLRLWWSPVGAWSVGLAAGVSVVAVGLAVVPSWLMATATRRSAGVLTVLALTGVLLPQYVLYFSWSILLAPTAFLGQYVATDRAVAEWAAWASSTLTLVLWHWPLAALVLAQGWRTIPADVHDAAVLEAGWLGRLRHVTGPLMARSAALAAGLCFALCLADFASLHLANRTTIGTVLAGQLLESQRVGPAVAGCLPLAVLAVVLAVALMRSAKTWSADPGQGQGQGKIRNSKFGFRISAASLAWAFTGVLVLLTLGGPLALLAGNLSPHAMGLFVTLQAEKYTQSLGVSAVGAVIALLLAYTAKRHIRNSNVGFRASNFLRPVIAVSLLVVAIIPGGLVAVAMAQTIASHDWLLPLRDSVLLVSLFQGVRFAGLALIVLWVVRSSHSRSLTEAAAVDGATPWQTWWHIHRPATWPTLAGAAVVVILLGLTEVTGSQIVAPPGSFSLSLFLLNQMHFQRDQQVVAACLLLLAFYVAAAVGLWTLLRVARRRRFDVLVLLLIASLSLSGCSRTPSSVPDVRGKIGRPGTGRGELLYPRGIDRFPDGTLAVVDKTGRVQLLHPDGGCELVIPMPDIASGKPTGLSVGPDDNIYVADTHRHRVLVFSRQGELVRQWGEFGQGDGQFIFPTDVAFLPDGHVLVSEYGAHDRISVFSMAGEFLRSFGSFGPGPGQFSRPQSMAVDLARDRLYITDACNHRIAVYNLRCELQGYMGSPGSELGQLRYPYGLALTRDGRLVVVEQGNNRVQVFMPDGQAMAVYGSPGRELGQLHYPWAVAIDDANHAYVVDGGNDRVQVWKLP